ncbi:phosphoribosyltransferase-like predicted ribonucleoside biosynthesis protein [Kineococcus xinjiangensis]|uniref:Phosphoribosyltransferase-like predicted ribonucleoside biosynthesis protein n=1 Tax=Kineococcus xinjiangensis TaxID=512762 RepID=A0A2S6IM97_9ACTN|nr:phosphoribosyltransferase domain-containing protein [Kineococcus xinjiangensis]PPK95362.1 phosphoribosyltransferase-like predicted ribonucleoside biosynthesis protein [Kineococcus xinjiangensis]
MSATLQQPAPWAGTWVARRLGVALRTRASVDGLDLADLAGLAVRRNPRRAHLLVSTVLGKHVPTDPRLVRAAGLRLGEVVAGALREEAPPAGPPAAVWRSALAGDGAAAARLESVVAGRLAAAAPPVPLLVVGYAETATGLGHCVADALRAPYLHSTRRAAAADAGWAPAPYAGFAEEHSHATDHRLLPADPEVLAALADPQRPLVLVDDELSTGRTIANTVRALHRSTPRARYVVASLLDLRSAADAGALDALAAELGCRIDAVALAAGSVDLPADVLAAGAALVATVEGAPVPAPAAVAEAAAVPVVDVGWPGGLPTGGRHGAAAAGHEQLAAGLPAMGGRLADAVLAAASSPGAAAGSGAVLVLGSEELMHAPLRLAGALAEELAARGSDLVVRSSTTTRSPVLAVDDPGCALRSSVAFRSSDPAVDGPGPRYAHNVAAPASAGPGPAWDVLVLVVDDAHHAADLRAADGPLAALLPHAGRVLLVSLPADVPAPPVPAPPVPVPAPRPEPAGGVAPVPAPRPEPASGVAPEPLPEPLSGPGFGSYAPSDVRWLLTDLSGVRLEAPAEEREEAIQSGGAHYAESLPVEYQPSEEYSRLFAAALERGAERVALGVGVVAELLRRERGDGVVLASLARAGTPVGILLRRWAQRRWGLDWPHLAVSIVRGRGIDPVALRWLAAHHDPAAVVFVDGWTGKGAIVRELSAALEQHAARHGQVFSDDLAVLADPGECVRTFGSREDYLIPSACLNSTVSGLVSRTVLNDRLLRPGQFHGAKSYAELAGADVSAHFLDSVCAHFDAVAARVPGLAGEVTAGQRRATFAGWRAVEEVSTAYGIGDVNLVKPGVGETTRVLLRRVPWRVLVRPAAELADPGALEHLRLLAEQRGVPVEEVPGLAYSAMGLIHPRYTRGATGADGRSAGSGARPGAGAGS